MDKAFHIRLVKPADYAAILNIYSPYVTSTAVTFEYDVPSLSDFSERIKNICSHYPCLVCEANGEIIGYCYSGIHRVKTAYQWSTECTIYIAQAYHRKGIAKELYKTLFAILKLQGFVNVYAGVSVPNEQSEKFHIKSGFTEIGLFEKIGYKLGQWHNLKFFQLILNEHSANPLPPVSIGEVQKTEEFRKILEEVNKVITI